MNKINLLFLIVVLISLQLNAQSDYFPPRNIWEEKMAESQNLDPEKLKEAVEFAIENEYEGAKDLRIAILKGFQREPYHYIAGKTKKRGGPTGLILKNGYIVAKWGDLNRVDMTFSVTKSYLSTVCGLALEEGLIKDLKDKVGDYVWDGTFDGAHNS